MSFRVLGLGVAAAAVALVGCGDDGGGDPCEGVTGNCVAVTGGGDITEDLQTALLDAQPGDTIAIGEGDFDIGMELSLTGVNDVTIRGMGKDATVMHFDNAVGGPNGITVENVSGITVEGLAIMNTEGDGLVIRASTDVIIRDVRVEWDPPIDETNGLYGLYPVNSENVLVEDVVSIGCSDAGIYVGESRTVIVRGSEAYLNVAGIQMENSFDSEIYDNYAHENAGGLMIFDLPGKEFQTNGGRHLAYNNMVVGNNTENFSSGGAFVNVLPSGLGALIMGVDDVELRDNVIEDNNSVNLAVVSYWIAGDPSSDPDYDPFPEAIYVHDNAFSGGGTMVDTSEQSGQALAALNAIANTNLGTTGEPVRDMVYDGISPPAAHPDSPDAGANPAYICFMNNTDEDGDADFLWLDGDNINLETGDVSATMPNEDITPYTCTGATQSPVTLPFL